MNSIAFEAQQMVKEVAEVQPGETVGAQIRKAERNLGYKGGDRWRVRAAWYGEAGGWKATAFRDLETRYRTWRDRQERRNRDDADLERARLRALREGLSASDPEFHAETVAALDAALRTLGGCD